LTKHRVKKLKILLILLLPLSLCIFYLSSLTPGLIEKFYSNGIYRLISEPLSQITGLVPISVAEIIVIAFVVLVILYVVRTIFKIVVSKSDSLHYIKRFFLNSLLAISIIYFGFVLLWGLNYNRLPFSRIASMNTKPASVTELAQVCESLIQQTNTSRALVSEDSSGYMRLANGRKKAFTDAYLGYNIAAIKYPVLGGSYGIPKGILLSEPMAYTGISGIFTPFTAEANVNVAMPDSMIPNTACHEMAHQRGFAREDEANFISYLTCTLSKDKDFQYSGSLLGLINSMNALYANDRNKYYELQKKYSAGVIRDLTQNQMFWDRHEGAIENISSKINDTYLKANRQSDGINSYGRMVDLLIALYREKVKK
jgi:hypothetical protein